MSVLRYFCVATFMILSSIAIEKLLERTDRIGMRSRAAVSKSDRKSTRLNSSHGYISYAVFCLKKKIQSHNYRLQTQLKRTQEPPHLSPTKQGDAGSSLPC